MKKILLSIFYLICSICFLVFKIFFAIQTYSLFSGYIAFDKVYFLFFNICLTLVTIIFIYKFISSLALQNKIKKLLEARKQTKINNRQSKIKNLEAEIEKLKNQ